MKVHQFQKTHCNMFLSTLHMFVFTLANVFKLSFANMTFIVQIDVDFTTILHHCCTF